MIRLPWLPTKVCASRFNGKLRQRTETKFGRISSSLCYSFPWAPIFIPSPRFASVVESHFGFLLYFLLLFSSLLKRMDMKAAARSKRAQSQRGKSKFSARHSHSQSRQQQKKNEDVQEENAQIGVGEPYEQLPSNWGRYEEPHSSGSEGEDPHKLKEEESVPVKSKGADYLYLLSQSQNPSTFDAHLPDYAGGNSMLYVRGQSLLSWGEDDTFIVNNEDTSSAYEGSFLSLDLHGLASQLAQLDLSKRLFVEDDILPEELRPASAQVKKDQLEEEREQMHMNKSELRESDLPPDLLAISPSIMVAERSIEEANQSHDLGSLPDVSTSYSILNKDKDTALRESLGNATILGSSGAAAAPIPFLASSDSQGVGEAQHKASCTYIGGPSCVEVLKHNLGGSSCIEAPKQDSSFENNEKSDKAAHINILSSFSDEVAHLQRPSCIQAPKHSRIFEKNEKSNEVTMFDMELKSKQFEVAAAEAELDALLDELDKPCELSASEVPGASSNPFFREGSSYEGSKPFQEKLFGSSNLDSTINNSSCILDDILDKTFDRGHRERKEDSHHSELAAGSVLEFKSGPSSDKNPPKASDDDFDAWLDSL